MFGTNHAKMFTIREREIGLHNEEENNNSSSNESSSQLMKGKSSNDSNEHTIVVSINEDEADSSMMLDSDDDMRSEVENGVGGKSVISEVDMRTSFILTSNVNGGRGNRRKKLLS